MLQHTHFTRGRHFSHSQIVNDFIFSLAGQKQITVEKKPTKLAFLDLLIEAHVNNELTKSDIIEEVDTFMFEGHDTVGTNIAFCLYLLAIHPEIQRKVQMEIDEFYCEKGQCPTYEDLSRMKYLENCIKETLRLYPSIPVMSRRIQGDSGVNIDGYEVPPGTNVIMLNYHLHRDADQFNDPESFNPDRFNSPTRDNYSYVPFSAGPRNCIGQK